LLTALLAVASLTYPAGAGAQQGPSCEAPPGTSGIDQYCESVPGAGGNRGAGDRDRSSDESLPAATRRALERAGKDGEALRGLAGETPSSPGGGGDADNRSGGSSKDGKAGEGAGNGSGSVEPEPSNNPLSAVTSAVDAGASAGPAFVWLLVALGLVLSALAWVRYRRRGHEG
jgi:hypothetical protein